MNLSQLIGDAIQTLAYDRGISVMTTDAMNRLCSIVEHILLTESRPLFIGNRTFRTGVRSTPNDIFYSFVMNLVKNPSSQPIFIQFLSNVAPKPANFIHACRGVECMPPLQVYELGLTPTIVSTQSVVPEEETAFAGQFRNEWLLPDFQIDEQEYTLTPEPEERSHDVELGYVEFNDDMALVESVEPENEPLLKVIATKEDMRLHTPNWDLLPLELSDFTAMCQSCEDLHVRYQNAPPLPTMESQFNRISPFTVPIAPAHRAHGGYGPALTRLLERNCNLGCRKSRGDP
ncbi:hypothetical protein GMRT_10084 [Giardia muris]|uniref:Uncharacterized protein n=1 Tax=Giardia muris TaxID=5742 RepID=A0A4Z1T4G4_GIAMU|nr:hypothetical protein GMRT_10084 [Giardia muris]|eukprot:TNJ27947.1 hypothetical protein GMRT_10084 [Giardia muris]